jgi:hypothetical protein
MDDEPMPAAGRDLMMVELARAGGDERERRDETARGILEG